MDAQIVARNDASRQRLRDLVGRLDDTAYGREVAPGWTVAATLAHLAFWDQSCIARWDEYARTGAISEFGDRLIDVVNEASLPAWRALSGAAACEWAVAAAEGADGRTATLDEAAIRYATDHGRGFILDRAEHRSAHLDEIERTLAL